MSEKKSGLLCLARVWPCVWPDDNPNRHIVEVELENNRTVMFLKQSIKDKHAPALNHIDADKLVLWRCSNRALFLASQVRG
jgi:hypothetical protein